ncbi:hypothetical protein ACMD2_10958 [Ananas comosus]|uniref:DUF538 domain-containing protein n=2 Tax=Ananas comosus TaxID=4615 RepID=A0A199UH86_ANACO|nr:hypothetical protein ACMD2_10958 [Ananas comosus]
MAKPLLPLTSLLLLLLPFLSNPSAAVVAGTANDVLPKFGLPPGLLPNTVASYSLSADGDFVVELEAPCYVQFSDLVYYEKTIKGKLSYGAISDLSGIQAKKLFVWLSVTGIVAHPDSRSIEFQVGFISESLSVDQFETVPVCRAKAGDLSELGLPFAEVVLLIF